MLTQSNEKRHAGRRMEDVLIRVENKELKRKDQTIMDMIKEVEDVLEQL